MASDKKHILTIEKTMLHVRGTSVLIELVCNDDYMAQVLYEDIAERTQSGTIILRIGLGVTDAEPK